MIVTANAFSQGHCKQDSLWQHHKNRFEADKVAFITTQLNLSPEQAQKFWPIYNKYNARIMEIMDARKAMHDKYPDIDKISEAEAAQMLDFIIKSESQEMEIKRDYWNELSKVFSKKSICKLYQADMDFHRALMHKARVHGSFGKSYSDNK